MILFSQMHHIISSVAFSFNNNEVGHIKDRNIERDQYLFKHKRWETLPLNDFKFLIIQIVYKHSANKFDVFRILNEITKEELSTLKKEKEMFILYKKTIQEDINYVKTKIATPANVIKMYTKDEISILGLYYFLLDYHNSNVLSRIQEKKFKQTLTFMDYFPKVKDHIQDMFKNKIV